MRGAAVLSVVVAVTLASPAAAKPPSATTGEATSITETAATLNGTAHAGNRDSTFHFEYGTTAAYGSVTQEQPAGSANTPTEVSAAISGLMADTTYHFRLVVTNAQGIAQGGDRTFTTVKSGASPPPPGSG